MTRPTRQTVDVARRSDPEDGVEFLTDTAQARVIRDDELYSGVRIAMAARIATAVVKFRLDVNFGDPITPAPRTIELPPLRENAAPIRILGALEPLSATVDDLAALRRSTYAAYRASLRADGQHLPDDFGEVVSAVAAFADPLAEDSPTITWIADSRRWVPVGAG